MTSSSRIAAVASGSLSQSVSPLPTTEIRGPIPILMANSAFRHQKTVPNPRILPMKRRWRGVHAHTMGEHDPKGKKQLNLAAAIRIIQNAGMPDPQLLNDDPDIQLQSIIDALCTLSTHDGLTGLVNAAFFHAVLSREIDRSLRTGRMCGLLVIDVDHFKQINDTYGHGTGDQVLQSVARQMKLNLRSMDTAARIGGEEFAVILPECTPQDAISAATRIHSALNPLILPVGQSTLQLTTSGGLVWTNPNIQVSSAALLSEADLEMYRAKRAGRARLYCRTPEVPHVSRQERSALMDLQCGESFHGH